MSDRGIWLLFLAMGLVTVALRASFLLLQDRWALPPLARRALAYVPPAVLAAITVPALFAGGGPSLGPVDARLPAGLLAIAVAWRTKSVLATILTGMLALWVIGWGFSALA